MSSAVASFKLALLAGSAIVILSLAVRNEEGSGSQAPLSTDTKCLAPAGISNAADPPCKEGLSIEEGGKCTPNCLEGFDGSLAGTLICRNRELDPSEFICLDEAAKAKLKADLLDGARSDRGCVSPSLVANAPKAPCYEGMFIVTGKPCTPHCNPGFLPSAESLMCEQGELQPPSFLCEAMKNDEESLRKAKRIAEIVANLPALVKTTTAVPSAESATSGAGDKATVTQKPGPKATQAKPTPESPQAKTKAPKPATSKPASKPPLKSGAGMTADSVFSFLLLSIIPVCRVFINSDY